MLTDTHCHLDLEHFDADRDEVLARARAAGLARLLIPAVELDAAESAVSFARAHADIFCAVGVHPNSGSSWNTDSPARIGDLAADPGVVAIGEIGLDHHWDTTPRDLQLRVFEEQLALAAALTLPVVIHNRKATADVLEILVAWQRRLVETGNPLAGRPGVLHSFSGDREDARRALRANFYLGVTGPVTFKNAPDLQALVVELPLDSLLIETDAPYLTPHPHRGKRNEPAHVRLVAEKIAELKGLEVGAVLNATYDNSARLFDW